MFDKKGNEIKQGEDPVRLAGHGELHILVLRLPLGPPETRMYAHLLLNRLVLTLFSSAPRPCPFGYRVG